VGVEISCALDIEIYTPLSFFHWVFFPFVTLLPPLSIPDGVCSVEIIILPPQSKEFLERALPSIHPLLFFARTGFHLLLPIDDPFFREREDSDSSLYVSPPHSLFLFFVAPPIRAPPFHKSTLFSYLLKIRSALT